MKKDMKKKLPKVAAATTIYNILDEGVTRGTKKIRAARSGKKVKFPPVRKVLKRRVAGTAKGITYFVPILSGMDVMLEREKEFKNSLQAVGVEVSQETVMED